MGLVKFGAGITQISGSIGGTVFSRNRFGNIVRPRTKPVNPRSVRQESARAVVSYLAEYWHNDLNVTERGLWDVYAAAVAMTNRLGETMHLTGFNQFMRTNCIRLVYGQPVIDAAPSILSLPEKDPTLVCSEETIATQQFTFTFNPVGWAANGDSKMAMLIYQGQPKLASRSFFDGPWRYMHVVGAGEGIGGTSPGNAAFPFAEGQKVWFQARIMTDSGRVTNLWTFDPRTIEADP